MKAETLYTEEEPARYFYAYKRDDGIIKVGCSIIPEKRFRQREMSLLGFWPVLDDESWLEAERNCVDSLKDLGVVNSFAGSEWVKCEDVQYLIAFLGSYWNKPYVRSDKVLMNRREK